MLPVHEELLGLYAHLETIAMGCGTLSQSEFKLWEVQRLQILTLHNQESAQEDWLGGVLGIETHIKHTFFH